MLIYADNMLSHWLRDNPSILPAKDRQGREIINDSCSDLFIMWCREILLESWISICTERGFYSHTWLLLASTSPSITGRCTLHSRKWPRGRFWSRMMLVRSRVNMHQLVNDSTLKLNKIKIHCFMIFFQVLFRYNFCTLRVSICRQCAIILAKGYST